MTWLKFLLIGLVLVSSQAWAHRKKNQVEVSRDIHFDGSVVRGRYQMAEEGVATVENEKTSRELLTMRTNFKDRLNKEVHR